MPPYEIERGADLTVIRVSGEIDTASADELRDAGVSALQDGATMEVDLGQVGFLDSVALGALIAIRREAVLRGLDFRIASASLQARRIIELTGLDGLFQLEATVEPLPLTLPLPLGGPAAPIV